MSRVENGIAKMLREGEERQDKREVRKVAKVKKVAKPEAEEADEAPKTKKAKGNGKATAKPEKAEKKASKKKSDEETRGPQEVPEGHVSVAMLADEAEITAQSARVKLRASDIERPEGRWVWADGSKALKKAREILGL